MKSHKKNQDRILLLSPNKMQKLPDDAIYVFNNGLSIYKLKNKLKAGERFKLTNYRRTALIQKGVLHDHLSKCLPPEMTNNTTDIITNPRSMQQKRVIHIQNQLVRGVLSYQIEEALPNNTLVPGQLFPKQDYYLWLGVRVQDFSRVEQVVWFTNFEQFRDEFDVPESPDDIDQVTLNPDLVEYDNRQTEKLLAEVLTQNNDSLSPLPEASQLQLAELCKIASFQHHQQQQAKKRKLDETQIGLAEAHALPSGLELTNQFKKEALESTPSEDSDKSTNNGSPSMANNNNNTKSFQYHYGQTNNTIPQARQLLDQFMENNSLLNQFPQLSNLTSNLTQTNMPKQNEIWIPLDGYDPKTMEATCTSKGTMTISNTKETVQNTARGTRKVTSIMEETVVLPKYLAEHKMLDKIESVVEGQFLVISYPLEQAAEKEIVKPVKISIKVQHSDEE